MDVEDRIDPPLVAAPVDPPRFQPAADVLSGETADVYFERTAAILKAENLDPVVTMELFARADAVLCGAEESIAYLREILGNGKRFDHEPVVESLRDGDAIARKEVVMRISARYSAFGLYETALLGILAQSTGWATAARRIVDAAAPIPVIGFGARHVHPSVADQRDYASVVGGCIGASTPAGARLAGLSPTGTMPHALILIFGDTVAAVEAFDRHVDPEVPRIALVDTFKDEAEESVRVADALGERLWGVRLDTPSERGRVTADLVKEVRARLDLAGHRHVRIVVSGGLDVERVGYFKEAGAPVDSFAVGSAISDASPIDFTGDLKEIDGRPIAKRGRIPGITPNPRLQRIDLHA
jgi:nicotinate phosphoribosyltransferase